MAYLPQEEHDARIDRVRELMQREGLDVALVYYDEFNIGNGWYLTGWCPQFESGAVLVPRTGKPMLLGGPESEPFAKLDSAVTETRNFPVFMVPDEEYPNAEIIDFPAPVRRTERHARGRPAPRGARRRRAHAGRLLQTDRGRLRRRGAGGHHRAVCRDAVREIGVGAEADPPGVQDRRRLLRRDEGGHRAGSPPRSRSPLKASMPPGPAARRGSGSPPLSAAGPGATPSCRPRRRRCWRPANS